MKESVRNEIVRLSEQGLSGRRIARQLQVSRHTVHQVLKHIAQERKEGPATPGPRSRSRRSWDGFDSVVQQLLERYPDLTAQRLWQELRHRGFTGSYATVWRRLQQLRPVTPKPPVVRFEADVRLHGETKERPLDRHAQEVPHLLPLPVHAYDVAPVVYRHVSAEGLVVWQANLYSVPWRLIGCLLAVRITADEVIVYGPDLAEVARHRLLPASTPGQRSLQPEHRPQANERLRRTTLEERFAERGPEGPRFLAGLVETRRCGWDQAQRVLEVLTVYRRADVQAALERAVRFGAFSLSAVQRILSATARPKPVLEVLADEERRRLDPLLRADPVTPRPLSAYQHLTGDCHAETKPAPDHPANDNPGPAADGSPPTPAGGSSSPESGGDR